MVEVGAKDVTEREAQAECVVTMTPEACAQLVAGTPKATRSRPRGSRADGRQAHARPAALLPPDRRDRRRGAGGAREASGTIRVGTLVRARDRTGVEMEALTAAAVAALSLYDTAKAFDRGRADRRAPAPLEVGEVRRLRRARVALLRSERSFGTPRTPGPLVKKFFGSHRCVRPYMWCYVAVPA